MTVSVRASLRSRLVGATVTLLVVGLLTAAFLVARAPLDGPVFSGTWISVGAPSYVVGFSEPAPSLEDLCSTAAAG